MYAYPDICDPILEDARPQMHCCKCGAGLYTDDEYFDMDGDAWCRDCFADYALSIKHRI